MGSGDITSGATALAEYSAQPAVAAAVHQAEPPIWERVGYKEPREARKLWRRFLADLPAVKDTPRDELLDRRILQGCETGGGSLEAPRRVVRVFVSALARSGMEEEHNALFADVLPALQSYGRALALEVLMVDARLGEVGSQDRNGSKGSSAGWGESGAGREHHLSSEERSAELARCLRESAGVSYLLLTGEEPSPPSTTDLHRTGPPLRTDPPGGLLGLPASIPAGFEP